MTGDIDQDIIRFVIEREQRDARIHDWIRSCLAKTKYTSTDYAKKGARRKARQRGCRFYAYPCRYCDGYHLAQRLWS